MANKYFFVGRAERIVIAILLVLASASICVYYLIAAPLEEPGAMPTQSTIGSADSLIRSKDYVGPPASMRSSSIRKYGKRTVLDLNRVDSLTLLRVPGIGPAFAHRILALRQRLGGYYTILQLQEVYGMDEDRYLALRGWFAIQTPPTTYTLSELRADELPRHPYLSGAQRRAINRLLHRHGRIASWAMLMREEAFGRDDSIRLSHYFVEPVELEPHQSDQLPNTQ